MSVGGPRVRCIELVDQQYRLLQGALFSTCNSRRFVNEKRDESPPERHDMLRVVLKRSL
jgi:hypothetical protein